MRAALHLAILHVLRQRVQTWLLAGALGLMLAVPFSLRIILSAAEARMRARAELTPQVLGARGSALDLMLSALYFKRQPLPSLEMRGVDQARAMGQGNVIPLHVRFHAQSASIVGTELDYFEFRSLRLAAGRWFTRLGDCVVGAGVARSRGLLPGGHVYSSQEQVFDLAGNYPLKMRVTGVLAPTGTADDEVIFADIKTTWLIEGLAHGHEDVAEPETLKREEGHITANAAVRMFQEVTEANLASFHFHGDAGSFPLTAALVVPRDEKSEAILAGRFLKKDQPAQLIRPLDEFRSLMQTLFRVENLVLMVLGLVAVGALAVAALVFALSFRLRRREFQTLEDIGVARTALLTSKACEVLLTAALGAGISLLMSALVFWKAESWVTFLLAGG